MSRPTITFFPSAGKASTKNDKIPFYLRVIFKRKKSEARLPIETDQVKIHLWDPITMRIGERNNPINNYLSHLDSRFQNMLILNNFQMEEFDAHAIKKHLLEIREANEVSLITYCKEYYQDKVIPNSEFATSTKKCYNKSLNHLEAYLKKDNLRSLKLSDFTNTIASRFKDYLINNYPEYDKVGMTEVSAAAIIKNLKPILSRAVFDELIQKNPFTGLKLRKKSPQRERLSIKQVRSIIDLDLSNLPTLAIYRDIFIFNVFTGFAYHDSMHLRYSDILEYEHSNKCIKIARQKSDVLAEIVMTSYAIDIIERFKKLPEMAVSSTILPKRSNKEINLNLKVIALRAGISINLSTHIARHSFRQLLSEADIVDQGVIKRMMGQSRSNDIDSVYYVITESRLIEAKEKFQIFLDKHLK